ncbi:hypothetical protein NB640_10405 [Oxalobacter vibrioformis]|uniref:Lysine transporter LysE n=1 Tax=Oxalobacter vibrioformis TaxID=933080 RepID=A0A9E9LYL6_9BURK|nr:hypothetical protein [Oxalobacter vibrioformis]WAW09633.1 hypothetical protein NB640_10405 [Oxalobacter vibrioformis]
MSIEFLITAFIIVITPGGGVIYTLGAGLSRGPKAGIPMPPSAAPSVSSPT